MSTSDKSKELRQKMEQLWHRTKDVFSRGTEEVIKVSKIGKLKIDVSAMQRQRQRQLVELGDKLLRLIDQGALPAAPFEAEIKRVDFLNQQIDELEDEIRILSGGPLPPEKRYHSSPDDAASDAEEY